MRKTGRGFHPATLKLSRNTQGWILFLDSSDKNSKYEQPHAAIWMFVLCVICFDGCSTHTYGASCVKEAFDLPHQDYSKLWTQTCLKLSVLNLDLLLILLLHWMPPDCAKAECSDVNLSSLGVMLTMSLERGREERTDFQQLRCFSVRKAATQQER